MAQRSLRSNLIRLAAEKPELRPKLLPLLKRAAPVKHVRMWMRFKSLNETPLQDGGKMVRGMIECGYPDAHDVTFRFSAQIDSSGGLLEFDVPRLPPSHPTYMFWMDVFITLYY